jgi:antitoxin ParD1/3/4
MIMNISFTDKQQHYIASQVSGGDYQNASEVVRDALRLHEIYRNRVLEDLRAEIAKGWDSKPSNNSIQDIINRKKAAKQKG